MKKASINVLSVLVILFLTVAYIFPALTTLTAIVAAFSSDKSTEVVASTSEPTTPVQTVFIPQTQALYHPTDSVVFDNGQKYPVIIQEAIVMVPDHEYYIRSFVYELITNGVSLILFIAILCYLIKFIVNINRGKIFEPVNAKCLRKFGWLMLAIGVMECINGIILQKAVDTASLSRAGYEFAANWNVPWSSFLLGLVAMFLGQVWSLGIKMREEQDLTI